MLMGRSVSSQRLARERILFLLVWRRRDARFVLGQCTLVGVSSVLRGTAHGVQAWSRRLQCHTQFASFFMHVVQSALGGPLVNSFRFSRFAAPTSV